MAIKLPVYMDHHATTPVDPRVLDVMLPYFCVVYGNAASIDHDFGYEAKKAVDKAREQVAQAINAKPDEIVFTSGATEADNIALFGAMEQYADKGNHLITCVTEHKAVLDVAKRLEKQGKSVTYLSVDEYGRVSLDDVRAAITSRTVLISIMAANNEIGTIAPIAEVGKIAHEHGILFHTDAAQAVGHVPIDVVDMHIDILSMSAHKIYGPKGVGALYVRRRSPRISLSPIIYGGGQEQGIRSGTLNVPGIVGFGEALAIARREMKKEAKRLQEMRDWMFQELTSRLDDVYLNGHPSQRLPHNLNIFIKGVESKSIVINLKEIALSTGSACTTTEVHPSHVISALGFGNERAHGSIRIGLGRTNAQNQAKYVVDQIVGEVTRIRKVSYSL